MQPQDQTLPGAPTADPEFIKAMDEAQAAVAKVYRRAYQMDPEAPGVQGLHQSMRLLGEIERNMTGSTDGPSGGDPRASGEPGPASVEPPVEEDPMAGAPPEEPMPGLPPGANPMEDAAMGLQADVLKKQQGGY